MKTDAELQDEIKRVRNALDHCPDGVSRVSFEGWLSELEHELWERGRKIARDWLEGA